MRVPDAALAACPEELLPFRKQTDYGPIGHCLEFPYGFLPHPLGFLLFSAVSLKPQNDTLLHHHVLLCLSLEQHRQALLQVEANRRAVASVMDQDALYTHSKKIPNSK